MNTINGKPVGETVLPEARGNINPERCECNINMTFEQLERTWKMKEKRGKR